MKIITVLLLMAGYGFLPKVSLLIIMFLAIGFDFITGIVKTLLEKKRITSKAMRRTIIKFCQYGGSVCIGLAMSFLSNEVGKYNPSWRYAPEVMSYFNNTLLVFIIIIELRSIVENLIKLNVSSEISKGFLNPVSRVLNVWGKDSTPVAKITIETEKDSLINATQPTKKDAGKN